MFCSSRFDKILLAGGLNEGTQRPQLGLRHWALSCVCIYLASSPPKIHTIQHFPVDTWEQISNFIQLHKTFKNAAKNFSKQFSFWTKFLKIFCSGRRCVFVFVQIGWFLKEANFRPAPLTHKFSSLQCNWVFILRLPARLPSYSAHFSIEPGWCEFVDDSNRFPLSTMLNSDFSRSQISDINLKNFLYFWGW